MNMKTAIPTVCPVCHAELEITRDGVVGPDSETRANCPSCSFVEVYE